MTSQIDPNGSARLTSWKAIAAYFERDERTVKRWEAERGMPVHRIPGAARSSVYAYTSELADWLKTADTQSPSFEETPSLKVEPVAAASPASASVSQTTKQRRRRALIVGTGILALSLGYFVAYRRFSVSPRLTPLGNRPALKHSASPEAEELYLQGLYQWNKRTPQSLNRAVDDFTQSIVRDPNYAPAYAGLANCYNLLREYTPMPAKDAYPRAIAAAQRAIVLDDTLAEAHNALAFASFYWNWDAATADHEFQRAIALDPNSVVAHHWYATFLVEIGRTQEALAEIEQARRLDPHSASILADKGILLYLAGQPAVATALLQDVEKSDPSFLSPHTYLAEVDFQTRDYPGYLQESKKAAVLLDDKPRLRIIAAGEAGLASSGREGMLRAMFGVQKELYAKGDLSAYELASAFCLLGDKQQALNLLETAVANHEAHDVTLRADPNFRPLHDDARFRRLIAQIGLPPLG